MHNRDTIRVTKALNDRFGSRPCDLYTVALIHRTRCIQHQRDVQRCSTRGLRRLKRDPRHMPTAVNRMREHISRNVETIGMRRHLIPVVKRIDPLLSPNRDWIDIIPIPHPVQGKLEGSAISVQAESRYGIIASVDKP